MVEHGQNNRKRKEIEDKMKDLNDTQRRWLQCLETIRLNKTRKI